MHQCKAEGSGRGDAFAQMVKSAKKNLLLTGTPTNGKSTSIKEILWRTTPSELLEQGFDHTTGMVHWAERYGKLQQVVELADQDQANGWVTNQKRVKRQPTEEPGIAPQLTANYLLHRAAFLELTDLGLPLVELKELPIFIDLDPEHEAEYQRFHAQLHEECRKRSQAGAKGAWSKFVPSTINYVDRSDLGAYVELGSEEKTIIKARPFGEGYYNAKERKLVEMVKAELAENRGCVIYNSYTGDYQMNERLKKVLNDHGIACEILNETNSEKRFEKLAKFEDKDVKVWITNMKLVEVGLDLMYWKTLIFYQLSYEVSVIRQSSRRCWRIGQDRECRVYYLVANGTQQMSQFMKIMSARGHAMLVEGRLDKSELSQYSRDSQSSLASDLADCFASSNLAEAWTRLAAKDLENVEMLEESEFRVVISQRMKQLANETRRLCGLAPLYDNVEELEEEPDTSAVSSVATVAMTGTEDAVDLFNLFTNQTEDSEAVELAKASPSGLVAYEEIEDTRVMPEPVSEASQIDLFQEFGIELEVVDLKKYKGKKKKSGPSEGQLAMVF